MKYFITLILLLTALSYGQIMEPEFPLVVNIVLILLILLTPVFWEYSVLNKNYESDFKMQSQRKVLGVYELIYAIAWTLLLSFSNDNYNDVIFLILIFWTFPLAELVLWFIYKKKKPFTVFIKENQLILVKRWTQKRNLTELTQIRFDRFGKNLKLDFKSKSEISIKTTEYNVDDIQKLLEILIEKSENNVFVPNNYEPKIKNSC
ncbi:hypothetical protein DFQ10_1223 [Winogradskyella eximia]|uniref:DUF5673 domain-containing protein n=1 Tax=Winogradskyella eximia TaxID=262006 RepID=A0A3D9GPI4_9FLAO|nr:hypothetical protein [Winogradskyella eximia]RED37677.1 hypothetical protein DFQ10_1223 [Winogradskyella eximia]